MLKFVLLTESYNFTECMTNFVEIIYPYSRETNMYGCKDKVEEQEHFGQYKGMVI